MRAYSRSPNTCRERPGSLCDITSGRLSRRYTPPRRSRNPGINASANQAPVSIHICDVQGWMSKFDLRKSFAHLRRMDRPRATRRAHELS